MSEPLPPALDAYYVARHSKDERALADAVEGIRRAVVQDAAGVDPKHRPEWLDDVPTGWCECGKSYPHPTPRS